MSCTVNVLMMMVLMVSARRDLDQVMELGELLLRSSSMVDNLLLATPVARLEESTPIQGRGNFKNLILEIK